MNDDDIKLRKSLIFIFKLILFFMFLLFCSFIIIWFYDKKSYKNTINTNTDNEIEELSKISVTFEDIAEKVKINNVEYIVIGVNVENTLDIDYDLSNFNVKVNRINDNQSTDISELLVNLENSFLTATNVAANSINNYSIYIPNDTDLVNTVSYEVSINDENHNMYFGKRFAVSSDFDELSANFVEPVEITTVNNKQYIAVGIYIINSTDYNYSTSNLSIEVNKIYNDYGTNETSNIEDIEGSLFNLTSIPSNSNNTYYVYIPYEGDNVKNISYIFSLSYNNAKKYIRKEFTINKE